MILFSRTLANYVVLVSGSGCRGNTWGVRYEEGAVWCPSQPKKGLKRESVPSLQTFFRFLVCEKWEFIAFWHYFSNWVGSWKGYVLPVPPLSYASDLDIYDLCCYCYNVAALNACVNGSFVYPRNDVCVCEWTRRVGLTGTGTWRYCTTTWSQGRTSSLRNVRTTTPHLSATRTTTIAWRTTAAITSPSLPNLPYGCVIATIKCKCVVLKVKWRDTPRCNLAAYIIHYSVFSSSLNIFLTHGCFCYCVLEQSRKTKLAFGLTKTSESPLQNRCPVSLQKNSRNLSQ